MTNWKADPKVQEILAGFGHGEVTFGGKREGLTMQIRTATEAEIDALLEAAVAASGSPPSPEQLEAISNVINLIDRVEEMSPSDREIYRAGCDALNAIARASSGCTGAPPDTFRNTFRNPVAQALWGDKEKGK